jgi:nitroimidazol reductase NimA-like FMN-containing flavoprotein (pyridoxamine 5'-phosphate oxidase superfamily)
LSNSELPRTEELRVKRIPEKQVFDREALNALLDEAIVGHVAVVRDGQPIVLPVGIGRDGDSLLIHGSTGSGVFRELADGRPLSIAVTLLDGLVYARSAFESSIHYRSAVIMGNATVVEGEEKLEALAILTNHMMPGRWEEVRETTKKELAATMVLRVPLERVSVKVSDAGPDEFEDDGDDRSIWAGVLPLRIVAGEPYASEMTPEGTPVSPSVIAQTLRLD